MESRVEVRPGSMMHLVFSQPTPYFWRSISRATIRSDRAAIQPDSKTVAGRIIRTSTFKS
jgi:hypothetical protein